MILSVELHDGNTRAQALAWGRRAFEALPFALQLRNLVFSTVQQAEPAIQCVPRQSLGTRYRLCKMRLKTGDV